MTGSGHLSYAEEAVLGRGRFGLREENWTTTHKELEALEASSRDVGMPREGLLERN